jgi:hypothetical protein
MLKVFVQPADGSGGMGVQVGVGAVGSEVVVLDGLNFGTLGGGEVLDLPAIPMNLPAGSRIALRSTVGNGAAWVHPYSKGLGADHSGRAPFAVDGGGGYGIFTYQPFGDIWYELIASTPRPFTRAIVPIFTYANGFDYYAPFYLAIGAAGSELALTSDDLIARTYNGNNYGGGLGYPNSVGPSWFQMNIDVPAGSRLSAKTYSAGNGSSGIVIYASLILL